MLRNTLNICGLSEFAYRIMKTKHTFTQIFIDGLYLLVSLESGVSDMTCKDCVHFEMCQNKTFEEAKLSIKAETVIVTIKNRIVCKFFKNKEDFIEVETIKSWLYEMALNNVGCRIEGDFSNACEEIISRLEGLKRYSMEKEGADNGKVC